MSKVYINEFTGIMRKFEDDKGFVSGDKGITWTKNNTPKSLIEKLPYYKEIKQ